MDKILDARCGNRKVIVDLTKLRHIVLSNYGKKTITTIVDEKINQAAVLRRKTISRDVPRMYMQGVYALENTDIRNELERDGYINIKSWGEDFYVIEVNEKLLSEQHEIEKRLNAFAPNLAQKQKKVWEDLINEFSTKGSRKHWGRNLPIEKEVTNIFIRKLGENGLCYMASMNEISKTTSEPIAGIPRPKFSKEYIEDFRLFIKHCMDNILLHKNKKLNKPCFLMKLLTHLHKIRHKELKILLYGDYEGSLVFFPAKIDQMEPPKDLNQEWKIIVNDDFINFSSGSRTKVTFPAKTLTKEFLEEFTKEYNKYYYFLGQITKFTSELKIEIICIFNGGELFAFN